MADKKSIFEALATAQAEIKNVGKNGKNTFDNYAYRGIDDVMDAVHGAFVKAGIFAVPEVLSREQTERTTRKGDTMLHTILTVKYTFYGPDGSNLSAIVQGEGMDRGDKSINKAMSGAYKYAMFQTLAIPTAEMIDSETESPQIQATPKKASKEQLGPELPIGRSAARQLAGMISAINDKDPSWWPDLCEMKGIKSTLEIKQKDYGEFVQLAQSRLDNLEKGGADNE